MNQSVDRTADSLSNPAADPQFLADMDFIQPSATTQRVKRARARFVTTIFATVIVASWLVFGYVAPDLRAADLSARPAPSSPKFSPQRVARPPITRLSRNFIVKSGDTLTALLGRIGVSAREADAAISALQKYWNARTLKPGQSVEVFFESAPDQPVFDERARPLNGTRFSGLALIPNPRREIGVWRAGETSFTAFQEERVLQDRYFLADTLIDSSVYEAARAAGIPPNLVVNLIRLFSFNTDFQRDIRAGDHLEVLYTRRFDENNNVAEEGRIYFAALTNRGKRQQYYALTHNDGSIGFYDDSAKSVRRLLMKTPIDGARLSSGYGRRKHPLLGYTRMHRGLDFAAPTGTPIFAAGDGTITRIGHIGSHGNMIKIAHRQGFTTLYAHMSRFARNMRKGRYVKQGQIIGYVGSSGLSTGPHLHYEITRNKRYVNPSRVLLPPSKVLNRIGKRKLAATRAQTDKQISKLVAQTRRSQP